MAYEVTEAQLATLNHIIGDIGGPVASKVSDALAALQAANAAGDKVAAQAAFDLAVQENIKGNIPWQMTQQWHDAVKASGDTDQPPVEYPSGGSWPPTLGQYETTPWAPVAPNAILWTQATVDGRISSAEGSGGRKVWGMITDGGPATSVPFSGPPGTVSASTGQSGLLDIKAGQFFSSYFAPDGYGQNSQMRASTSK